MSRTTKILSEMWDLKCNFHSSCCKSSSQSSKPFNFPRDWFHRFFILPFKPVPPDHPPCYILVLVLPSFHILCCGKCVRTSIWMRNTNWDYIITRSPHDHGSLRTYCGAFNLVLQLHRMDPQPIPRCLNYEDKAIRLRISPFITHSILNCPRAMWKKKIHHEILPGKFI